MNHHRSDSRRSAGKGQFATTQWSVVLSAGECVGEESGDGAAAAALAQLCEDYWYPLYTYVRRRGYGVADAQDLTQAFFVRLLEKESLRIADPQLGRFRSFLLASLDHFLANEYDRTQAEFESGGKGVGSLNCCATP